MTSIHSKAFQKILVKSYIFPIKKGKLMALKRTRRHSIQQLILLQSERLHFIKQMFFTRCVGRSFD